MVGGLSEFGVDSIVQAIVVCEVDMSVIVDIRSEEVVCLCVTREGMHCHHIASGHTVSEEFERSRGTWF